jgi:transcriptional regulator with XRE-family HTH domain
MKLNFKPERLKMIRVLKGMQQSELSALLIKRMNRQNKVGIEKWELGYNEPNEQSIAALCSSLNIPIGWFYYDNVELSMGIDLMVKIKIVETGEVREFKFKV